MGNMKLWKLVIEHSFPERVYDLSGDSEPTGRTLVEVRPHLVVAESEALARGWHYPALGKLLSVSLEGEVDAIVQVRRTL